MRIISRFSSRIGWPTGRRLLWLMTVLLLWPAAGMAQQHGGRDCDTTPIKLAFHDTVIEAGQTLVITATDEHLQGFEIVWRQWGVQTDEVITGNTISITQPGTYSFYVRNISNNGCPDREGDTLYVHAAGCDTTPVKLAFHDTAFCEGDSLLIVATDRPHEGYSTIWRNLASAADVLHEGDSIFITEPGTYAFHLYNMVNNGCPDREGDTVSVAFWPKPQAFLPKDTLETCGSRTGALTFAADQPHIALRWSDGDTASSYRFAYKGDTLDTRFCTLFNVCGDTLTDSLTVRFLPPYAYLGGDSLVGCRGDSVLFDMGQYNRHLPAYDDLRFVWTLRGETVADGRPGDETDPTRLKLYFPQDSGLLTVRVFLPYDGEAPDGGAGEPACPVATDTIDLKFYIWPDIDFFVRSGDTTICHYDSIGLFLDRDSLVFSPDAYYIWLFNDVPFDTTADKIIYAADTGVYTVTGVNYCSRHSESFVLSHHPKARITATVTDTNMCPEIPVEIDGTLPFEGNLYVWFAGGEGGEGDGDEDGGDENGDYQHARANGLRQFRNPEAEPEDPDTWPWDADGRLWVDKPGAYTLYIRDSAGCTSQTTVNINEEDCTPKFEAPNVFTPNGDGINDVFKLKTMEKLFEFEIRIFNRWGNQVLAYNGEPEDFEWNGKIKGNGQNAADGVYFYVATYKDYKGKKKKQSGSVTILR